MVRLNFAGAAAETMPLGAEFLGAARRRLTRPSQDAGGCLPRDTTVKVVLVGLLLALAAGCAARVPPPTQADALRASAQWPGTTLDALVRGYRLYLERCSACHALELPRTQVPEAWPRIVGEMAERSRLDVGEVAQVIRYLMTAAAGS